MPAGILQMTQLIDDRISGLLTGDVRHKSHRIRAYSRFNKKPPEVMVKISGYCKNAAHIAAHFDYISRNGKLEIEDEQGQVFQDRNDLHEIAEQWQKDTTSTKKNARYTTQLVLSMPDGTEPKAVKQAVREFAKKTFADNHQYVFALHTDTDSPHVHLTVNNLGFDGKRLHVRKGLPQLWREQFANELGRLGIDADATSSFLKSQKKQVTYSEPQIRT